MGRYAFFNTGFEYKFGFGVQSSHDIVELGGTGNYGLIVSEQPIHCWDQRDLPYLQRVMDALEEHLHILGPFNFSKFDISVEGTEEVYAEFWEMEKSGLDLTNSFVLKYRLASVIFHQLLYTKKLVVKYEL